MSNHQNSDSNKACNPKENKDPQFCTMMWTPNITIRLVDTSGNVITGLNGVFFRQSLIVAGNNPITSVPDVSTQYFGPIYYSTGGQANIPQLPYCINEEGIPTGTYISIAISEEALNAAGYQLTSSQSPTITTYISPSYQATIDFVVEALPTPQVTNTINLVEFNYPRYSTIGGSTPDVGAYMPIGNATITFSEI